MHRIHVHKSLLNPSNKNHHIRHLNAMNLESKCQIMNTQTEHVDCGAVLHSEYVHIGNNGEIHVIVASNPL